MLTMVGDNGQVFELTQVPHLDKYEAFKRILGQENYNKIMDFLTNDIVENKFFVGGKYPYDSPKWEQHLRPIYYSAGQDEVLGGMFLGLMVIDHLIHCDEEWLCLKSDITKRDFMVMFYWRKENV